MPAQALGLVEVFPCDGVGEVVDCLPTFGELTDDPRTQPLCRRQYLSDFFADHHLILNQRRRFDADRFKLLIKFLATIGPSQ